MKLNEVIRIQDIKAGGPGSGRKPGTGVDTGLLKSHGWKYHNSDRGEITYRHPKHGLLHVDRSMHNDSDEGQWAHGHVDQGSGVNSLHSYVQKLGK